VLVKWLTLTSRTGKAPYHKLAAEYAGNGLAGSLSSKSLKNQIRPGPRIAQPFVPPPFQPRWISNARSGDHGVQYWRTAGGALRAGTSDGGDWEDRELEKAAQRANECSTHKEHSAAATTRKLTMQQSWRRKKGWRGREDGKKRRGSRPARRVVWTEGCGLWTQGRHKPKQLPHLSESQNACDWQVQVRPRHALALSKLR
jgi:hypothetical protein